MSDVFRIKKANKEELDYESLWLKLLPSSNSNSIPLSLHKNPLCWLPIHHCPCWAPTW